MACIPRLGRQSWHGAGVPAMLQPAARSAVWAALLLGSGAAVAAPSADQRGFVSDGIAGGLYFQRCEAGGPSARQVLLQDKSPGGVLTAGLAEVRRAMLDADRPVYIEFRGTFTGDQPGQVATASQFYRAIGHVATCSAMPPTPAGVRLLAEGTQPAWRVLATPAGTRLERVGHAPVQFAPVKAPVAAPVSAQAKVGATDGTAKARSYVTAAVSGGTRMRLDVTEQACTDGAAESAFGARVVAQWGEQRLEGCAARF
jgi:uncharacterized membrane protein